MIYTTEYVYQIVLHNAEEGEFHTIDLPSMPPRYEPGDIIQVDSYIDPLGGNPWNEEVEFSGNYVVRKASYDFGKRHTCNSVVEFFCVNLLVEDAKQGEMFL